MSILDAFEHLGDPISSTQAFSYDEPTTPIVAVASETVKASSTTPSFLMRGFKFWFRTRTLKMIGAIVVLYIVYRIYRGIKNWFKKPSSKSNHESVEEYDVKLGVEGAEMAAGSLDGSGAPEPVNDELWTPLIRS